MTPHEFLDLACKLALDHEERTVNDAQFHPLLRERGLSPHEIESLTIALAAAGRIERHRVVGGFADFRISEPVFLSYAFRTLPASTVIKAQELYKAWSKPGGGKATAERLAAELNLPRFQSIALFQDCITRLGT